MNKALTIDIGRCTGCHTCEFMCSFQHHDEFNPRKARIHTTVFLHEELAVPVVCSQCEDAWCQRICPSGAISKTTLRRERRPRGARRRAASAWAAGCA